MTQLHNLLSSARQAVGDIAVFADDHSLRGVHKRTAASVARHSLREMSFPAFVPDPRRIVHTPLGTEAGKRTTLSDAVMAGSRCAMAGAHVVVVPSAAEAIPTSNGQLAFAKRETRFDVIQAAQFVTVPDGDELADSALPVLRALVDLDTMPSMGVRIPLSRTEQKSYADGQLADATLVSIALGIARAADATLLAAIMATNPSAFTLSAAATLGVEFAELRALVGADADGASVGQDGTLRAAGILAELTPDNDATLIGAFSRSAIAVADDIALIAERIDTQGNLTLTAWVNMQALLPLPGAFWTVGA